MNKLIQDIGFVQHIQKPKNARKIPIVYYEEIKVSSKSYGYRISKESRDLNIKWINSTPYVLRII